MSAKFKLSLTRWSGIVLVLVLVLLVFTVYGRFSRQTDTKRTAQLLGPHQLAAFKHIPGEPELQQLVLVWVEGDEINIQSLGEAYDFEVSNDGKYIAYFGDNGLYIVSTTGEKAEKVSDLSPKFDLNSDQIRVINKVLAWSPDNTRLAFVCGGDLYQVNITDGKPAKLLARRSPDQLTTKEGAEALAPRIDGIVCPDWVDNNTLIYQDFYRIFNGEWKYVCNIMKVNSDGSGKQTVIGNGQEPVISPDKGRILFHRNDNLGGKIMLAPVDSSEEPKAVTSFTDANREPMNYSWSQDGKYVIFDGFVIDPEGKRQSVFTGEPAQDIKYSGGESNQVPSSSPDGKWIIFSASLGPKLVRVKDGNFEYDSSKALDPLNDLNHIRWVKGK